MPRGGARKGAGRKSGDAWKETRPVAVRDMAKARVREVLTTAQDPLAVLVEMAADHSVEPALRIQAAHAACPFIYPRLSAAVVATSTPDNSSKHDHQALVDRVLGKIARLAPPAPMIEGAALQSILVEAV